MREIKIEIYGRVQGVGFRHFVKEKADKLGLRGVVKNRKDGSVLIFAQGTEEELKKLLDEVGKGPRLGKVDGVSYYWKDFEKRGERFVIDREDRGFFGDQSASFVNLGKRFLGLKDKVPRHVAIIPDGNRRWARKKGLPIKEGHSRSANQTMMKILDEAEELGIGYVTLWGFSTENWKREGEEVKYLMDLLANTLKILGKDAQERKIRFRHLGRRDRLPKKIIREIEKLEKETEKNERLNLQLCLDYGGRDEIVRAVNKMLKSGVTEVKEEDMPNYLDSAGVPDPDLIIRTSGENRMSGLMPFQTVYSELKFVDVNFPDFTAEKFREIVLEFGKRSRRFGK